MFVCDYVCMIAKRNGTLMISGSQQSSVVVCVSCPESSEITKELYSVFGTNQKNFKVILQYKMHKRTSVGGSFGGSCSCNPLLLVLKVKGRTSVNV